jgi:hypothetical protein
MTTSSGQRRLGGILSGTTTVKEHVLVLPELSEAVHLTVLIPTGKLPSPGWHRNVGTEQLSVAVTFHVTVPVHCPGSAETVRVVGHESCGGTISITTTMKAHVLVLPELSEAVH